MVEVGGRGGGGFINEGKNYRACARTCGSKKEGAYFWDNTVLYIMFTDFQASSYFCSHFTKRINA